MDINITPDVKYLDGSKWHCSDFIKKPITSSWFKERISFVVFAIGNDVYCSNDEGLIEELRKYKKGRNYEFDDINKFSKQKGQ